MSETCRDVGLVRAELVDALRTHAEIFREKAAMEIRRAEYTEGIASKVERGEASDHADMQNSAAWERNQQLLGMRFQESQMRCNRLLMEHGEN